MLSDAESADPNIDITLHREAFDSVLGILRKRAPGNRPLIVHAVNDEAAMSHGHRWNGLEDVARNTAFEVEHFVLDFPEQVTESLERHSLGKLIEIGNGRHGNVKILLCLASNGEVLDSGPKIALS